MGKKTIVALLTWALLATALWMSGQTPSKYPIADKVAEKVIQKYQTSTCEQLRAQKQQPPQPPSAMEVKAIEQLRNDPKMRQHFLNKIAGPVANKMFECGMIP